MTKYLLFHSFSFKNNLIADPFYNLSLVSYKELIFNISKKIEPNQYTISFDDGYESIKPAIKYASELGFRTAAYIVTSKINQKGFLSENDILDLKLKGTIIGSHTHSHKNLTKLNTSELRYEFKKSKDILCKILNSKIDEMSLPYGEFNKEVIEEAMKHFSKVAISRPLFFNNENLIGRISIHNSNFSDLKFIVSKLKNKKDFIFICKLIKINFIKTIFPNSFYRRLKSIVMRNKTINFF